uniref:Uncharacterized protein n=1 Tax=Homalodisca liturata TaxID=320908 RepID=A0A1B6K8U9_9HEMI
MTQGCAPKATCLCLGPTGSGKSLLLRRLQDRHVVDHTTATVPTVGTNLVTVSLPDHTQVLMVLAKMDASYRQMRNEALLMLQYRRLKQEVPQHITTAEVSATTGEGLNMIIAWLGEK